MSNWAKAKVNFKNMTTDVLDETLKAMGYYADFDKKEVHGAYSFDGSNSCDCVLMDIETGKNSEIGLSFSEKEDGSIDIKVVGDWYNKTYNDKTFTQALQLEYSTANLIKQARMAGYTVQSTEMIGEYKRHMVLAKVA